MQNAFYLLMWYRWMGKHVTETGEPCSHPRAIFPKWSRDVGVAYDKSSLPQVGSWGETPLLVSIISSFSVIHLRTNCVHNVGANFIPNEVNKRVKLRPAVITWGPFPILILYRRRGARKHQRTENEHSLCPPNSEQTLAMGSPCGESRTQPDLDPTSSSCS